MVKGKGVQIWSLGQKLDDIGVKGKGGFKVAQTRIDGVWVDDGLVQDGGRTGPEVEFKGGKACHVGESSGKDIVESLEDRGTRLQSYLKGANAASKARVLGKEDEDEGVLCGGAKRDVAVEVSLCDAGEGGRGACESEEVVCWEMREDVVEELVGKRHGWWGRERWIAVDL